MRRTGRASFPRVFRPRGSKGRNTCRPDDPPRRVQSMGKWLDLPSAFLDGGLIVLRKVRISYSAVAETVATPSRVSSLINHFCDMVGGGQMKDKKKSAKLLFVLHWQPPAGSVSLPSTYRQYKWRSQQPPVGLRPEMGPFSAASLSN